MSYMTGTRSHLSLHDEEDASRKTRADEPVDTSLNIQVLLYHAFEHGQRNPITANPVAFFDEWYDNNAHKLPEGLRADRSICDLWDHLMARESE